MSRRERFAVAGPARIDVRLPSGSVHVLDGSPGEVTVAVDGADADRFRVEQRGSTIVLEPELGGFGRWRLHDVTVTAPPGVALSARLASASLAAEVSLESLEADVASGQVRAGAVERDARVKTAAGDVRVGAVGGALRLVTASGDVDVTAVAGDAEVTAASGDVRIGTAAGDLTVRTASGDVRVAEFGGRDLRCTSLSGDVEVGLPPGRSLDIDLETLSGSISNAFEVGGGRGATPSGHARLRVRSISGDVALVRAVPAPA